MGGDRTHARPKRVFVGRQPELAALSAALAAARASDPQVVLIEGEAGVGKSSLISEFFAGQPGVRVVAASGEQAEALLPYGLVDQLTAEAVAISAGALAGLQLLSDGLADDADPLKVGAEVLGLISSLQGGETVAVAIEDLQWVDPASARSLLFACRRLTAGHVLVILTCRPSGISSLGEGWERFVSGDRRATRLKLSGLGVDELGMLCRALGRTGLSHRAFRRLRRFTGGNPLLTRELLAELADDALNDVHGMLRAPRSLAEVIHLRLAALSSAARDLASAAAVLGEHSTLVDVAAVAGTAGPTSPAAALGEAERAGILLEEETPSGWRLSFPHLLVRQAVYGELGAERRRALHLRAAGVVGGEHSLAHRTAAAAGADPALASDLDHAADQAAKAGKLRLAARYLQQAATVSEAGPKRAERTLSSFELLVRAADVSQAEAARPAVELLPASVRRNAALGQLALLAARPADARTLLQSAWDAHDPAADNAAGQDAAIGLGMLFGISGSFTASTMWLERATEGAAGSEPWYEAVRGMRGMQFTLSGQGDKALSLFADLPERAAMVPAAQTSSVAYRGIVKLWIGDLNGATEDLGVAAKRIRTGLQVQFPGQPLAFLAEAEFRRGRWDECQDHAELALSLARDADLYYDLPIVHSVAARVPACRGDWAGAAGHVEAAEDMARAFGGFAEILAASSRSILGFARDDPDETLLGAAMALAVPEIDRYDDPAAFWWRPLQIWALIRTAQLAEAETTLLAYESRATDRAESLALINAAWLRGWLAMAHGEFDEAEQLLRSGCEACACETFPFHRGLLNLQHGRCLSRLRQRKAAIVAVRAADDIFSALGARPFTQATSAELGALGVRPRGGGDPDLPGLTTQELRVARLVASGLSNRQAAEQLCLSPKTVEYHLASTFTKLGVSHRHQLAARIRPRQAPGGEA
jgi:DNA-binding CsgD family transcriptional regulator/tetratricopeptide (TPR) repeat protein